MVMQATPEVTKTSRAKAAKPPVDVERVYDCSPTSCRLRGRPASSSRSGLYDQTHDDLIGTIWGCSERAFTGVLVLTGRLSYTGDGYSAAQTGRLEGALRAFLPPVFQGLKGAEYAQTRLVSKGKNWLLLYAIPAPITRLLAFEAGDEPLDRLVDRVERLSEDVAQVSDAAIVAAFNTILRAADGRGKEEKSQAILRIVRRCAERNLATQGLQLTQDDVAGALQAQLDSIRTRRLGYDANKEVIDLIRPSLNVFNLRLAYEGNFVSVRCSNTKNASVEFRLASEKRETVLTSTEWPALSVIKGEWRNTPP